MKILRDSTSKAMLSRYTGGKEQRPEIWQVLLCIYYLSLGKTPHLPKPEFVYL